MKTESNGLRTKMLLLYVGPGDSADYPKIEIQTKTGRLTLRENEKTYRDNDMIESKLKVKNANSEQVFRPDWVSSRVCIFDFQFGRKCPYIFIGIKAGKYFGCANLSYNI